MPSLSALCGLGDVEELFGYQLLFLIDMAPLAHFYVSKEKPECLLIAIMDGNGSGKE